MLRYAVYRCLYGEDFVQESIRSIAPYVDKIFVFWTDRVWGDVTSAMYKGQRVDFPADGRFDGIRDRIYDIQIELAPKVFVDYDHVVNNRNQFTHLVNDCILPYFKKPDTIIVMEVDYVWRKDQIELALSEFEYQVRMGRQHASSSQVELWKTYEYQAIRNDSNRKAAMFWNLANLEKMPPTNRHADTTNWGRLGAFVHNMGFCASTNTTYWKHITAIGFSQAIGDGSPNEGWFDMWRTWDFQSNNSKLEPSKGCEHLIPFARPYNYPLPEVLEGKQCPT